MHGGMKDITGQIFGRWTVLAYAGSFNGMASWWCRCECGATAKVCGLKLRQGRSQSCGCLRLELQTKHGAARRGKESLTYRSYVKAKTRCRNPNNTAYEHYGGRGIEFRFNSFDEFLKELGPRPSVKHSVDRKDSDGHYEPGNVRWATQKTQMRNRRVNRKITANGVTRTLAEWAELNGIRFNVIIKRIDHGWCNNCAVTVPPLARSELKTFKCEHQKQ